MDFTKVILKELVSSQRIIRSGVELAPRFTVWSPEGKYVAFMGLLSLLPPKVVALSREEMELMRGVEFEELSWFKERD